MKQRGRKSTAELSIVSVEAQPYPDPPENLLPEELELWRSIVMSRESTFFDPATLPLLSEYCRLKTQVEEMAEQVEQFAPDWFLTDDGLKRYKNLTDIRDKIQGRMIALARSMRLTQQARYVPDKAGARPKGKGRPRKVWEA